MATKKLQILDYTVKQANNADTLDGLHAEDFATSEELKSVIGHESSVDEQGNATTATGIYKIQDDINAISDKIGDKKVSEQISEATKDKVDKVNGKGLSTNDYTTAEKNKLSGIPADAEANQNAFSKISVGSTTIEADSKTDVAYLIAGNNIAINPDTTNKIIKISATDTVYKHPATSGNKHIPTGGSSGQILKWSADGTAVWGDNSNTTYSNATETTDGLMSATDKTNLDMIVGRAASGSAESGDYTPATGIYKIQDDINAISSKIGDTPVSEQISDAVEQIAESGRALEAERLLEDVEVGDVDRPVYFYGGNPVQIGYTIQSNVPANAKFTDTNTTYSAGTGISLSGTTFSNSGVRSVAAGTTNGTISVNTNGNTKEVAVKGLGSAAYTDSSAYDESGAANAALDSANANANAKFASLSELVGDKKVSEQISDVADPINNNLNVLNNNVKSLSNSAQAVHDDVRYTSAIVHEYGLKQGEFDWKVNVYNGHYTLMYKGGVM